MKKSLKIITGITLLILAIITFEIFTFKSIKNILYDYNTEGKNQKIQNAIKNYEAIECQFNILNPSYSIVSFQHYVYPEDDVDLKIWQVDFYDLIRPHPLSFNWEIEYTGGINVENTTFDDLVDMVKEDCSQFQNGYANPDPDGPRWTYNRAKTTEEMVEDIREHSFLDIKYLDVFKEIYGDMNTMTDEELVKLKTKIDKEGLDKRVQDRADELKYENFREEFEQEWEELTEPKKQKIISTYGQWQELNKETLIDYSKQIQSDVIAGKFSLE